MKKIEAIIRTVKFDDVKKALAKIGVQFFTLYEVRGYGLQRGEKLTYRGANLGSDYIPRLQMEIVSTDEMMEEIIDTILTAGRTGEVGDGKIFVTTIEKVVRIRTGELDEKAI